MPSQPPITLIASPFHFGHRDRGIGAGPTALMAAGAEQRLIDTGHRVTCRPLNIDALPGHEIGAVFAINRAQATAVREAVAADTRPILLVGDCNAALGARAGLDTLDPAVIWFDAHGDFHTPDTTTSGFFDGCALNALTGRSWRALTESITGFRPVPDERVLLAAARDLDPAEETLLRESAVTVVSWESVRGPDVAARITPWLDALAGQTRDAYVHVDLDVLDPDKARINPFQTPGGLHPGQLVEVLAAIGQRFHVRAASVSALDPTLDPDGRGVAAGLEVLTTLAGGAA